ncbi:MAG: hypothetical protein V4627_10490 [Pseudomonadota bacterium]
MNILLENRFLNRVLHKTLWALVLPLCALAGAVHVAADADPDLQTTRAAPSLSVELPSEWQGAALRPLALSDVELRFAKHFPGSLARMTDDKHTLVLRTVNQPTRMLHPATDCYRGLGYRIHSEQLEVQANSQDRWRCFVAQRQGRSVRVCERIEDANGQGFTDTSSWYWASIAGQSHGPWRAITVATPL